MTIEEAKKQLEDLIKDRESFLDGQDDEIYQRDIEALGKAVDVIEKQIPKKTLENFNFCRHRCSTCLGAVRMDSYYKYIPYCPWCGQALDWGDEE